MLHISSSFHGEGQKAPRAVFSPFPPYEIIEVHVGFGSINAN